MQGRHQWRSLRQADRERNGGTARADAGTDASSWARARAGGLVGGRAARVWRVASPRAAVRRSSYGGAAAGRVSSAAGAGRVRAWVAEERRGVDRRRVDVADRSLGVEAWSLGHPSRKRALFAVDEQPRQDGDPLRRRGQVARRQAPGATGAGAARRRPHARRRGHQRRGRHAHGDAEPTTQHASVRPGCQRHARRRAANNRCSVKSALKPNLEPNFITRITASRTTRRKTGNAAGNTGKIVTMASIPSSSITRSAASF